MSKRYIIGLMGANRTGVLTAVTNALAELGGDIHEASQKVLQGHFTILLAADFPAHRNMHVIETHLRGICAAFGVDIYIHDPTRDSFDGLSNRDVRTSPYSLTVSGLNAPGVIGHISARLARDNVDIGDLYGVQQSPDTSFMLMLELLVPELVEVEALEQDLLALGHSLGLEICLRPAEVGESVVCVPSSAVAH